MRGAVAVNAELGGDLVRALEALADGLDDRERLRGEIAVATAQARFAARIVPAVPLLALGLLGALSARPRSCRSSTTIAGSGPGRRRAPLLDLAAVLLLRRIARGVEA